MQTFRKTKMALAIGSALMVMAGAANAAALVPLAGATKTVLATQSVATAAALYAEEGTADAVNIAFLATGVIANGGATTVNTGTIANDDVTIQFGSTIIPQGEVAVSFNQPGIGNGNNITVTITPAGNARVRINNTSGALEYTADGTVTTPVWATVTISAQVVAGNALTEGGVAIDAATAATTAFASNDFILTPTVKTFAVASADKISGLTVDFKHPVAAPSKTTLSLFAVNVPPLASTADISNAATTGITAVTYAAVAGSSSVYDVAMTTPTAVDWDNSGAIDTADADLYVPKSFNTGVELVSSPLSLTVAATGPAYSNIFTKTTGVATNVSAGALAAATDGAKPVIVTEGITFTTDKNTDADYQDSLSTLSVVFSEPMGSFVGFDPDRELLENIFVGANSLAALSMNSDASPFYDGISNTEGLGTVVIADLTSTDIASFAAGTWTGQSITVNPGITVQETNDTDYTANLLSGEILDTVSGTGANGEELAGGVGSGSLAIESIAATTQTAVAPKPSIAWGTDTNAKASASSATAQDQIDTITVTFNTGKEVKFNTGKSNTDLAKNLVVDVFGKNGIRFQVRPLTATLDSSTQISIKVPTAFIYKQLTNSGTTLNSVWVSYVVDNTDNTNSVQPDSANNTLVALNDANVLVTQGLTGQAFGWTDPDLTAAGAEPVVLPLVFTATYTGGQSTLLTQSVQTTIAGSQAGSLVEAYLAYWIDQPTGGDMTVDVLGGSITKGNDKIQTGLAIEFADQGDLEGALYDELSLVAPAQKAISGVQLASKAVAAKDIPVYVKLVRSNDTTGLGNNPGGNTQSYINARAILAYDMGHFAPDTTNDNLSPIYACTLNPNTGAIKGTITGKLDIKTTVASGTRGLHFLDVNGASTDIPSHAIIGSSVVAQPSADGLALPGSVNLNLLMGIDPSTTTMANLGGMNPFVLLVHRDNDEGKYTLLTSADSNAVNYMPFAPDLNNTKTNKGEVSRTEVKLSVTDVKAFTLPASANWALYGLGDPATNPKALGTDKSLPRMLVGLNEAGIPTSFWTSDEHPDMGMMIAGNKVGVATELDSDINQFGNTTGTGQTLSSISANNTVAGAVGLAWSNGGYTPYDKIFVAQNTGVFAPSKPASSTVPAGWSLMTVPTTATFSSNVDAIIKVGAQVGMDSDTLQGSGEGTGQFSWFAEDGALPSGLLTAGDAVFVHAIKAEKQ